jgi:hypothetical protein
MFLELPDRPTTVHPTLHPDLVGVIRWLEKQDPDGKYLYYRPYGRKRDCLWDQYLREKGRALIGYLDRDLFPGANHIAYGRAFEEDWTYGRALQRAKELAA